MACQRYIELNPVRANMAADPADYVWSSYRCNGLRTEAKMWTPHPEYLNLGDSNSDRQEAYRSLFSTHVDGPLLKSIREAVNKGMALGSDRFKDEIEALHGRRVRPAHIGRPRSEKV